METSTNRPLNRFQMYVVWHPDFRDGSEYARAIYQWFHHPNVASYRTGLGIPVYYRYALEESTGEPRPIFPAGEEESQAEAARHRVIVVLVDANLVADYKWRTYVDGLFDKSKAKEGRVLLLPVSLHSSAYNVGKMSQKNFVRLPLEEDTNGNGLETRKDLLIRSLSEAMSRYMVNLSRQGSHDSESNDSNHVGKDGMPVKIFISHAKADGTEVAKGIRNYLSSHTQIESFFDENDISYGFDWSSELIESTEVNGKCAAMISVHTDAYAERPWCRREIHLARTPKKIEGCEKHWRINPIVVASRLSGELGHCVPEYASSVTMRWKKGNEAKLVDVLLREVFFHGYYSWLSQAIQPTNGTQIVTWIPDSQSLGLLFGKLGKEKVQKIIFPGWGLSEVEENMFKKIYPNLEFQSFEQLERSQREESLPS